jgi:hypothetical protein
LQLQNFCCCRDGSGTASVWIDRKGTGLMLRSSLNQIKDSTAVKLDIALDQAEAEQARLQKPRQEN